MGAVVSLAGGDSASPKVPSYAGRKVWGVYVAGSTFRVWTHAEVAELGQHGVEGVMPIVVPPQDSKWWEEGEYGYPVLEALVREAKAWGVPKGAPLCLDVEQHQADQMVNLAEIAHAWAIASRGHGYRTWTYSGLSYLNMDHYGFRWVADWPTPTPSNPEIPKGFNAWQYATDTSHGIDLDVFEAGRDYMTPDLKVVVLQAPNIKEHISETAASSQPPDGVGHQSPGTADDAEGAGATDTPQQPAHNFASEHL